MSNFELIDDYLSNKLPEADRKSFEQQMEGDPALKSEVEFQQQIVEGVKQARSIQLKQMLNNVPVGGSTLTGAKIAAGIITTGVVVTSLYFYFNQESQTSAEVITYKEQITQTPLEVRSSDSSVTVAPELKTQNDEASPLNDKKVENKVNKTNKVSTPVQKPSIQPADPTVELSENETSTEGETSPGRTEISASKMEVITEFGDKKHSFHYQFSQGKLLLFGPFDKSLYEILEIHGEGHAVFLFYRENYYLLDEKQSKITPLSMIKDGELLKKLKEYRGR